MSAELSQEFEPLFDADGNWLDKASTVRKINGQAQPAISALRTEKILVDAQYKKLTKAQRIAEAARFPDAEVVLFHHHASSEFYGGLYHSAADKFLSGFELARLPNRDSRAHLCALAGKRLPVVEAIKAGEFRFTPGESPQVIETGQKFTVNTWTAPPLRAGAAPCKDIPPAIKRLLSHVLADTGDGVVLARFINWLAFIYQTNARTDTAWVWWGAQGTGKGITIEHVLKPLLGAGYVKTVEIKTLRGAFNGFMNECLLLNIDEAELGGRDAGDIEAVIKRYVASPTILLHEKNKPHREIPNFANVIVTSNRGSAAGLIERGDRRFNVANEQTVKLPGDTDVLLAHVSAELPAFAGYLRDFRADATLARTAMANEAKQTLVEASETSPEGFANALRSGDLDWFLTEYFTLTSGRTAISGAEGFRSVLEKWIAHAERRTRGPMHVAAADVAITYNAILQGDHGLSAIALGRFLARAGVRSVQQTDGDRRRGYVVNWNLTKPLNDAERLAFRLAANNAAAAEIQFNNAAAFVGDDSWLDMEAQGTA